MNIHCKYDELVEVNKLKPHPKNRNKHPEDQIDRLAKILRYQGLRAPIVVSRLSGKIVKGHGTLQAIKKNGWDRAPVVMQDFEDDDQEWLFVQSDNAIAMWAELDLKGINQDLGDLGPFDIDLIGIKDFTVTPEEKPLGDEEAVPETRQTDIQLGDLFQLGEHRLLCGDSTDKAQVEKLMNGEKADMVFTDPPYGVNAVGGSKAFGTVGGSKAFGTGGGPEKHKNKIIKANVYSKIIGDDTTETAIKAIQIAKQFSNLQIFWGAQCYAEALKPSQGWIVWDKNTTGNLGDGELAWTNQNRAIRIFKHTWNGLIKESERKERRVHPTQKPIALAVWCFENYGEPETVLDLFGGSGSTLIACEKTNRKCFMMELDPQYCQVIIDRWEQFTGKKAVKHGKA